MLHVARGKNGKYFIGTFSVGSRNQLSGSEQNGLASRRNAIKNLRAQMRTFNTEWVYLQDDTKEVPVMYKLGLKTIIQIAMKTQKRYMPGKHIIRKKK